MTHSVRIDDRRRFRELWKELVFARLLAAGAAGLAMRAIFELGPFITSGAFLLIVYAFLFAAPSWVAKRGWIVPVAVMLASAVTIYLTYILDTKILPGTDLFPMAVIAMAGAGLGVAEGQIEKSMATNYCGLLGGIASGALACRIIDPDDVHDGWWFLPAAFVMIHVGIGLSLALGRWMRDWPGRRAATPPAKPS